MGRVISVVVLVLALGTVVYWGVGPSEDGRPVSAGALREKPTEVTSAVSREPTAGLPKPRRRPPRERGAEKTPSAPSDGFENVLRGIDELLREGRADEAVARLEAVLREDPNHERALEELGMIHLTEYQSPEKAAEYFRKVLAINPANEFAVMELVGVSTHPSRAEGTLEFLQKLQQSHPGSGAVSDGLAELLMSQGRLEEALPHLARSAQDPRYAEFSYSRMASVYQQLGDTPRAIESYRRAILHKQQEIRQREASGVSTEMVEKDLARSRLDLAQVLMRDGEFEEAEQLIEEAGRDLGEDWEVSSAREELRRRMN